MQGMALESPGIRRILVTGATGFIGSHLVSRLLAEGYAVSVLIRDLDKAADRFPEATLIEWELTVPLRLVDWQRHLAGVDVVINTVGIIAESGAQTFDMLHIEFPRTLFKACEVAGVKRVIQISALGAEATATTRYHRSKHSADMLLRGTALLSITVKPSLVFGARGKSTEFFRALAALPVQVLIDNGNQQVQPIHIDDLVELLVRLTRVESPPVEIAAVGPEPLSFRDMLTGYRQWLADDSTSTAAPPHISLPYSVTLLFARLLGFLKSPFLNVENLRMLQQGNVASPADTVTLLGAYPVPFQTALRRTPATDADRWHARLYFLPPLLRWVVGFVWIYTGIISAFVYPVPESYAMLERVGMSGWMLPVGLYGAAILDLALGAAVILRYRILLTGLVQLAVIASYTLIISLFLPEFWIHPFGPILKNIPFMMAILILMAVERR